MAFFLGTLFNVMKPEVLDLMSHPEKRCLSELGGEGTRPQQHLDSLTSPPLPEAKAAFDAAWCKYALKTKGDSEIPPAAFVLLLRPATLSPAFPPGTSAALLGAKAKEPGD